MKMSSSVSLMGLFPTPLYSVIYDGDTKEMIKYFDSCDMRQTQGPYGSISKNSYIIDHPVCKEFSSWVMHHFKEFATKVMRWDYKDLQFSQSWLTYKEPGQFHKAHTHPNTIISSVFYYDVKEGDAAICFSKEAKSFNRPYIEPSLLRDYQDHTFSQEEIYFYPKQNNLIIFPSYLVHGVPPNKTNKTRKALGINGLTKGTLGDEETISQIIFGRYV